MSKLKVQNFGPITSGFTEGDGFMDFRKVTVFIGNQGTGKSSVAKLFSTCSWLEKALFQGRITSDYVIKYNRFVKEYCAYQNLKNYFRDDTIIEYRGRAYTIIYRDRKLEIHAMLPHAPAYQVPQVMYVPAERNFLSAVDDPDKLKGLPKSLVTFWDELRQAQRETPTDFVLPIGNARFVFDKSNKIARLVGHTSGNVSYRLRLSEASSGFQSFVPLLLVSRYLAGSISREYDPSRSELSGEALQKLRAQIAQILANDKLVPEVQQRALEELSSQFRNETFLNIVEEPEQNLFPKSQQIMLYQLLEFANTTPGNALVLTTHSPYIINYLTLAIKAEEVRREVGAAAQSARLLKKLEAIVPKQAAVAATDVVVYELNELGQIAELPTYDGLPSDENDLNEALGEANARFSDMVEIELAAENG
ncbi:AAA family ATPase [Hymenobacter sp. ASUV-10]|uniref:AAA family ATPase n=1 Tax=Hymenobacter aranciens TaxID=3063996 RepID=A0ABT9B692_9BACT|nr:AAA family ATPase [Hymenobacter sp. ASUV-10]MDO7873708.1 AAA family ATPase [Hymenobacter sp. ASUV-10]